MACKECKGRGWIEQQAFYTDGSPSREIEQAPCPACAAVTPDVMDLLDRLADEGERNGPPLPPDLSSGPSQMIKSRNARIGELEAALRRALTIIDSSAFRDAAGMRPSSHPAVDDIRAVLNNSET